MQRPLPNEYAVFYKGYIDKVPDVDIINYLENQKIEFTAFLKKLGSSDLQYKYGEDKWTVAEVIGHCIDTERVMAYRLLRFSRQDKTEVAGFEQEDYVKYGNFNSRSLDSLVAEFEHVRAGNLQMIGALSEEQSLRKGEANGSIVSVRGLVYIIGGHLNHHWSMLKERYGLAI